jgi:hypothetical protein
MIERLFVCARDACVLCCIANELYMFMSLFFDLRNLMPHNEVVHNVRTS